MGFNIDDYKVIDSLCKDGYAHDIMTGRKYESDSCPEVWKKVHKIMHKESKLKDIFGDFHNIREENNRILALALENKNYKLTRYAIGGDTDFNMEFKNELEFNNYCKINNINKDVKNLIIEMYKHKYCLENFSLMLSTGGKGSLQLYKGNKNGKCNKFERSDNICMYIYNLKIDFYDGERTEENKMFDSVKLGYRDENKEEEAQKEAKNIMCTYLKSFNDIYDYCKVIYNIDEELVNKILKFAETDYKKDFNTGITDFIEIIKMLWESKRKLLTENI